MPVFLGREADKVRMRDRLGIYSFGDGAGAMVLQAAEESEDGFLGAAAIACMGGGRKVGMQVIGGGTHAPIHEQLDAKRLVEMKVDVIESGRHTPYVLTEGMKETVDRAGVDAGSVDLCVIPEGNAAYMTDELREAGLLTDEWNALEPKIFENLTMVGATGSAAVAAGPRLRLEDRRRKAGGQGDGAGDRDEQVEVRRNGAFPGPPSRCRRTARISHR